MRTFRRLALVTTLATWFLIVLGGYVSAVGAGDACPDWPLCHGQLLPPLDVPGVAEEYAHRLAAAVVGGLVLLLLVLAWSRHRDRVRLRNLTTIAFGLLVAQIGLGGLTVLSGLAPPLVAAHLGLAAVFLVVLVLLTVRAYGEAEAVAVAVDAAATPDGAAPSEGAWKG